MHDAMHSYCLHEFYSFNVCRITFRLFYALHNVLGTFETQAAVDILRVLLCKYIALSRCARARVCVHAYIAFSCLFHVTDVQAFTNTPTPPPRLAGRMEGETHRTRQLMALLLLLLLL